MKFLAKLCIPVATVALLAACAATPETESTGQTGAEAPDTGVEQQTRPGADDTGRESTEAMGAPGDTGFAGSPLEDPDSLLSKRVVYFDFDKSDIKSEYRDIIKAHAGYLADNPDVRITLEGHADERGTREYNMGLGERRANSVRAFMLVQGASRNQIKTVSYGEERPVAFGHDEESWRLNRRVEIVYR